MFLGANRGRVSEDMADKGGVNEPEFIASHGGGMVDVTCDLCGSVESRARYKLRHSCICACERCGFAFVNPRAAQEVLSAKLQAWAEQDVVDAERLRIAFDARTRRLYGGYLERMEEVMGQGARRLVDVGCSVGAFLQTASERGWDVKGVEVGRASAGYVGDVLKLPVHNGSLYDYEPGAGTLDAVVLLEVIEHLESPSGALARIYDWLRPGGVLLVSTPNYNSLYRRLCGSGWWVINCEDEHIMLFTPDTLSRALEKAGFEVGWRHIRGLDVLGIVRNLRRQESKVVTASPSVEDGYYASRSSRERMKALLGRVGLLQAARGGLEVLNSLFSARWSPLYGLGEQLVFLARKPQ